MGEKFSIAKAHIAHNLAKLNAKNIGIFFALLLFSLIIDQYIKMLMLGGFAWDSEVLTIGGSALVYNKGIAFSMLSFLESSLKYIQLVFLALIVLVALLSELFARHYAPLGLIVGAGISNVLDRFMHGGVVDYIFYHYGFEFAIFNAADVLIDVSVGIIILQMLLDRRKANG